MAKLIPDTSVHDAKFKELEAEHGECARLEVAGKMYVFRALSLEDFEDYQERCRKPDARISVLNREIAQLALVHPTLDELRELFARKPVLPAKVSDELVRMAGADIEFTVKKG